MKGCFILITSSSYQSRFIDMSSSCLSSVFAYHMLSCAIQTITCYACGSMHSDCLSQKTISLQGVMFAQQSFSLSSRGYSSTVFLLETFLESETGSVVSKILFLERNNAQNLFF